MIEIVLRGAPKGKGRPRFSVRGGHARAFTPAATRSYEGALRVAAGEVMGARPPMLGPLKLEIVALFPVPESWSKRKKADALAGRLRHTGKPDFDNLAKTVDALNEIVWKDDAQVVDARIRKAYSEMPALIVRVRSAEGDNEPPPTLNDTGADILEC